MTPEVLPVARKSKSSPGPYLLHLELLRDRVPDAARYPYTLPAVRGLSKLPFHPKVTFLVGENGSGKSTILEAVAVGCAGFDKLPHHRLKRFERGGEARMLVAVLRVEMHDAAVHGFDRESEIRVPGLELGVEQAARDDFQR